jgi:transglutaminase-like putative cysteine protease
VVGSVAPRDVGGQIQTIAHWLDAHFRYLSDPVGVELLRDPGGAFTEIRQRGYTQGDCDEAAMLAATLGMANGIPARFRALAFYSPTAPYSHVVCDLLGPGRQWIPIDITKPADMEIPPTATRTLIQPV